MDNQSFTDWAERQSHIDQERARAWQDAVDKLSITFEAEQGGGWPRVLVQAGGEQDRLALLKRLGFRVRERYDMDDRVLPTDEPMIEHWARISGGLSVNLTDGSVCTTIRRQDHECRK